MFALLRARLGGAFKTKVGLALIGALVVGGGGTAMAMATSHGQLLSNLVAASPTAHSDGSSDATKAAGKGDQDDKACTGTATETSASPTAHSGDESSSATKVAGQDDQETNENAQDEQNETDCKGSSESSEATRTPEPTERPEATRTPGPSPTSGPGGD